MGLVYCTVEQSEEKLRSVMTHLGINPDSDSAGDSSEEHTIMDTEDLLEELSEVQRRLDGKVSNDSSKAATSRKKANEQARKKSVKSKGKGKGKATLKNKPGEGKIFHTRSMGATLRWSKEMNPDTPISN